MERMSDTRVFEDTNLESRNTHLLHRFGSGESQNTEEYLGEQDGNSLSGTQTKTREFIIKKMQRIPSNQNFFQGNLPTQMQSHYLVSSQFNIYNLNSGSGSIS